MLMHSESAYAAGHERPLPSIAASVPGSRISSTLPALSISVPNVRMSRTLPANNGNTKLSMLGTARRGFRRKDINRRDHGSRQPSRSKPRRSDKPNELVLRVVPIDISGDDGHSSCQQEDLAVGEVETHSADQPANDDDSDTAPWQFERTARLRQGKYFKKSGRRSVSETPADALSSCNNKCPQQVCSVYIVLCCCRILLHVCVYIVSTSYIHINIILLSG